MARNTRDRGEETTPEPIDAARWGEIDEIDPGETVDGDFNGAPALAGVEETQRWEGSDVLDAMRGAEPDARLAADEPVPEEMLEDLLADRRALLLERLDEARELGLGGLFEEVAFATEPLGGSGPVVADADVLRGRLEQIDAAIEEIELRIDEADPAAPPRRA
jgi:hypothetical protein